MDILDFNARFQSAFGIVPVLTSNDRTIPGGQYLPILNAPDLISDTPSTFEDTEFRHGDEYLNFSGGRLSKTGNLGNVFAPPLIWVPRKGKRTIITNLNALPEQSQAEDAGYEVVERYGDSEWDINIQGLIVDMDQHIFPLEKLQRLRRFFEISAPVEVVGQIWDVLNIRSIWFGEFIPYGVPGFQDTVSFTLQARSIRPVEFSLNGEVGL